MSDIEILFNMCQDLYPAWTKAAKDEIAQLRVENERMLDCYATFETIIGNGELGVNIREVIKAEAQEREENLKLRLALAERDKTIEEARRLIVAAAKAYNLSAFMFGNDIRDAKIWLSAHPAAPSSSESEEK